MSVDRVLECGRPVSVDVYDLHVEGDHNFFADGFLVHNCLLIDDPNNPLESENKAEREKVNALWDTNIYNRINDGLRSIRIGVQQRTHALDWTGHVLARQGLWAPDKRSGWLLCVMPAECELSRRFTMPPELTRYLANLPDDDAAPGVRRRTFADWRTVEGESVHPARYSLEYLAAERQRWEGTGSYAGQMMQRPALQEGALIKRGWFEFCRLDGGVREIFDGVVMDRPRPAHCSSAETLLIKAAHHRPGEWDFDWLDITVDAAAKKTERGANWGMLAIAGKGGRRFVLDDRTQRGDILEIVDIMRDMVKFWRPDSLLIEDKASGEDLMKMLRAQVALGDVPPVAFVMVKPGTQGKEERLDSCKAVLAGQMVHLLEGATWLEDFVEELAQFPVGARSDRVDALTQCLNHHMDSEAYELPDW